jgi:hypothetical protein
VYIRPAAIVVHIVTAIGAVKQDAIAPQDQQSGQPVCWPVRLSARHEAALSDVRMPSTSRRGRSSLRLRFEVNSVLHLPISCRCLELAAFSSRFQNVVIGRPFHTRDSFRRRVLIGLTFLETSEFERLDTEPPIDEHGHILRWETDDESFPPNQARWLELYKKHRAACIKLCEDGSLGDTQ